MPVEKRHFVARHIEKIVCGVVAFGLLLTLVYAINRRASLSRRIDVEETERWVEGLEAALRQPPPPSEMADYSTQIQRRLAMAVRPPTVRPDLMQHVLPQNYPPIRVGTNKTFALQFLEPLLPDSIEVTAGERLVEVVNHPADGDYTRVEVQSHALEGEAAISGDAGDVTHIYPIVIDSEVGKTAYPPVEVTVADRQGRVMLQFKPDPRVEAEEVALVAYQMYRRDYADPLGEFEPAGRYALGGRAGRLGRPGTTGPAGGFGPGGYPAGFAPEDYAPPWVYGAEGGVPFGPEAPTTPARRTARAAEEEGTLSWVDSNVTPGERYGYRVAAVGSNTYPAEGEQTGEVVVDVFPNIDFRFKGSALDRVRFDVAKSGPAMGGGAARSVQVRQFYTARGEEIGGVFEDRRTGRRENFLTGYTLVDFHPNVIRPDQMGVSARVIYADADGNLHVRWRGETGSKLFDMAEARGPAGAAPTGYPYPGAIPPEYMPPTFYTP